MTPHAPTTIPEPAPAAPARETPTREPLEPTTPIRPSEAIRLGCLTTVPAFGLADGRRESGEACALEAAILGGLKRYGVGGPLGVDVSCPQLHCRVGDGMATYVIVHLNDDHRWSRERIADWLAGMGL